MYFIPVKVVGRQGFIKGFQSTFFPPELDFDLVHMTKSTFGHLNPFSLKVIPLEVPELSRWCVTAIHEYKDPQATVRVQS